MGEPSVLEPGQRGQGVDPYVDDQFSPDDLVNVRGFPGRKSGLGKHAHHRRDGPGLGVRRAHQGLSPARVPDVAIAQYRGPLGRYTPQHPARPEDLHKGFQVSQPVLEAEHPGVGVARREEGKGRFPCLVGLDANEDQVGAVGGRRRDRWDLDVESLFGRFHPHALFHDLLCSFGAIIEQGDVMTCAREPRPEEATHGAWSHNQYFHI